MNEAAFEARGGLNIDAVRLNFADGSFGYSSFVSSLVAIGSTYIPGSELAALGAPDGFATTMGTSTFPGERMRVTVGFPPSSAVPEPSTYALLATSLVSLAVTKRRGLWKIRRSL